MHTVMDETKMKREDYEDSIYSIQYVKQSFHSRYLDIYKEAFVGSKAPNAKLLSLDGFSEKFLLDFQSKGRPLVLNFGSCTWPPFVAKLARFNEIIAEFCDEVDFLVIYIEEAHPTDGWSFRSNYDIETHRSIEDRLLAAKQLRALGPQCPIMVDKMDDQANKLYGGLYERLYIILNSVVVYEGERGPVGYKLEEVNDWLTSYLKC